MTLGNFVFFVYLLCTLCTYIFGKPVGSTHIAPPQINSINTLEASKGEKKDLENLKRTVEGTKHVPYSSIFFCIFLYFFVLFCIFLYGPYKKNVACFFRTTVHKNGWNPPMIGDILFLAPPCLNPAEGGHI